MYSSTDSFDSSLVLKDSGSSSTSPSRLPRIFVENHPCNPRSLDFKPGAMIVFIKVWPVLKSLPHTGNPRSTASVVKAGTSTVRLGAPFGKGATHFNAADAETSEGAIASSLFLIPDSNACRSACTSVGCMNFLVDAHHTISIRSH